MAKRKTSAGLTNLERFGGTAFFVFYLLLLPLAAGPARRLAEELLEGLDAEYKRLIDEYTAGGGSLPWAG